MKLREPVGIVAPIRTPTGRLGGGLASVEPSQLLAHALRAVRERIGSRRPDDVLAGNVRNSIGNIARVAALEAGLGVDVPAATVDRQCASSLEALVSAAARIQAGMAERILVGGVESASRCPWLFEKTARPYAYFEPRPYPIHLAPESVGDPSMGETAEILADEFGIEREAMDRFAVESHRRAAAAYERGDFAEEVVPVPVPVRGDPGHAVDRDETLRGDTSLDALAKLPPAFRRDGRVTAGNSSPLSDGASACWAASRRALEEDGLEPAAWLTGTVTVALEPRRMGMGPALAVPRLLEEQGLTGDDVELYEINEAFAAQILAVNRELRVPPEKLNVNGGALALGHPLGATGVRLVATLACALRRRGLRRGVASLCIGGGQGMAVLLERF
jgi:acetyl-CoA C-acetyltransferase